MRPILRLRSALAFGFAIAALSSASGQTAAPIPPVPAPVNLAQFATATASYVSGDTTLAALNSGFDPRNSRDGTHGTYGNWNRTTTQWVEYDWSQPISTARIEVYWWNDRGGIGYPSACRLLYWDGTQFTPVANPTDPTSATEGGLGLAGDRYNVTAFAPVTTTRLRLEIDPSGNRTGNGISTGIVQWKVIDTGQSPKFPPTVIAGVDRVVVLPGQTYLNAKVLGASPALAWSKDSGPGQVGFANAGALATTATFSSPGHYTLRLTATSGGLAGSSTCIVAVESPAPAEHLEPVYTKAYKLDSPLWNDRIKQLIVHWIPHCIDQISDLNLKEGGINNFIQAGNKLAGRPYTNHVGYPFSNAWVHNTIEAMCVALQVDPRGDAEIIQAQAKMKATLDAWIPIILAAQEPDGYLQTRFTLDRRGAQHWDPRTRGEHEGYVAGYFLESAIADYLLTKGQDRRLYDAAKRLADCWDANLGPAPKKAWYDGHEEMEQALVRFGRFVNQVEGGGQGDRYVTLAQFLIDSRGSGAGGGDYDQTKLPAVQQYEAVGHAVRAVYLYSGMADIAVATGNPDYQSAVRSLWDNVVNKKLYLTGGVGSGETSEGFGKDFSLRNNSYCESCSSCGELFFQYKMNLAYGDAKYADLFEDTLYNAILGDVDLDAENFTYTNPLSGQVNRTPWHNCPCCVSNLSRTLLMLPTWMYAKDRDDLYVNLFIGSTATVENVAGTDVEMVQATDYPWSGKVGLTINPAKPAAFALKIRVPARNASALYSSSPAVAGMVRLTVNGQPVGPLKMDRGYAVLDRTWKAGDQVDFELPMAVQRVKAIDQVEADRGRVALRYGPLIYNFESVDEDVTQVLAAGSALTTQWRPDLLRGVVTINGTLANGAPLTAIPNYARGNRGGRTLVWFKDQ